MKGLTQQLRTSLLKNSAIQIKHTTLWTLPISTYDVTFKRVKRSKMDILMKMMLLIFDQIEIRRAANLTELLLVEELFIADLLKKMERMGLIRLEKEVYKLTSKGHNQLETGIIVEEMEEESTFLSYSPVHDEIMDEISKDFQETEEAVPSFRYANNQNTLHADQILKVLANQENEEENNEFQTVVDEVISFNQQKIELIPCIEFQVYNQEQDLYYARVWNTWHERWDNVLEKCIEEYERLAWREKWSTNKEDIAEMDPVTK